MPKIDTKTEAGDFARLVELMSEYAKAKVRMAALENDAHTNLISLADDVRETYADLQGVISQSEQEMEVIARKNPQWFSDSKTVKTPFGTISFRRVTSLEVPNEELTIVLIEQRGLQEKYLRTRRELNLEALEDLSDDELNDLRIKRKTDESFTAKPAKVDLGKAVKAAAEKKAEVKA